MEITSSTRMAVVAALDYCRCAGKFVTIPDKSLYVLCEMAQAVLAAIEADIDGVTTPIRSERIAAAVERSHAMLALHRPKLAEENASAQRAVNVA